MPKARRQPSRTASPADHHASRLQRLRSLLKKRGFDALLITNANDIRYLTGFCGDDSYALVTGRGLFVLSDFRYQEELAAIEGRATIVIRQGPMTPALIALVGDVRPRAMAVQAEHLTVELRSGIATGVGSRRVRDSLGLMAGLRMVKDESEVRLVRRGVAVQEAAMLALLPTIRPGQSEADIAARLEFEMKVRGADAPSFSTIVAARANGSRPHYRPGRVKAARGRPLLIDWGARVGGYCSDMTRTFSLGSWPRKLAEVYQVVLDAQLAAIAAIRPGRTCAEIDGVARGMISKAGYGPAFGHGLGHGIGLDIHEGPRLAKDVPTVLQPGMIVTVEPGVYLPGLGGVRIEDDIVVTQRGGRNLCSLPKDLKWATLHG